MIELNEEQIEKANNLLNSICSSKSALGSEIVYNLIDSKDVAIWVCNMMKDMNLLKVLSETENDPFYLFERTSKTCDFLKKGGFSTDHNNKESFENQMLKKSTIEVLRSLHDGNSYTITKDRPKEIMDLLPKLANLDVIRKTDRYKYGVNRIGRQQLRKLIELKSWKDFLDWIDQKELNKTGSGTYKSTPDEEEKNGKMIDIFISHSSTDKEKVKLLISILRTALNLNQEQIRCTSVAGYKLTGGKSTDETLRQEIIDCKIFIGVLTENSIKSTYVLFELGARWGLNKLMKPLVCEPSMENIVKGPLSGLHCLNGSESTEIIQLVKECASILKIEANTTDLYLEEVDKFTSLSKKEAKNSGMSNPTENQEGMETNHSSNFNLSEIRERVLKKAMEEYPNNYDMQEYELEKQMDALDKLQNPSENWRSLPEYNVISETAAKQYPTNYDMQLYEI